MALVASRDEAGAYEAGLALDEEFYRVGGSPGLNAPFASAE